MLGIRKGVVLSQDIKIDGIGLQEPESSEIVVSRRCVTGPQVDLLAEELGDVQVDGSGIECDGSHNSIRPNGFPGIGQGRGGARCFHECIRTFGEMMNYLFVQVNFSKAYGECFETNFSSGSQAGCFVTPQKTNSRDVFEFSGQCKSVLCRLMHASDTHARLRLCCSLLVSVSPFA